MESDTRPRIDIIDELRRRKVLRSTIIYSICGWCLLQWFDALSSHLAWPTWTLKLALTMIVLGFPVVVALSWVFDITPQGVRRTNPGDLPDLTPTSVSRAVNAAVGLLLLATVAMLAV